jgi:Putative MetA-pathway of phenol degradation
MKHVALLTRARVSTLALLALATLAVVRFADGAQAGDKSQYTLFNPTPKELMREMTTDRPDKTESPYTVDAGHFQFEMDLVNYTFDRERAGGVDTRVDAFAIAPINLKVGLCNQADLQVVVETWNYVRTETSGAGATLHQRGFGDVTTRLKYNFWGNDGGKTAFAAMPFVKLPTNQDELGNNSVEGGLILPLAVGLPLDFGMGLMTEFDFNRDATGGGRHTEFVNSVTFSHERLLVRDLGGYVEFFSLVSAESGSRWIGSVDLGLTYGLSENVRLDAGVNIGVTKAADDLNPFVGLSWRF